MGAGAFDPQTPEVSSKHLVVVVHSRTGSTEQLADAAVAAARSVAGTSIEVTVRDAFEAGVADVRAAHGILIATPARFGWMSGACKDFFERVYHPCLEHTAGLPYALVVKGDTDVEGAVTSVERIAAGLRWRLALPPLAVVGALLPHHLEMARELGAAFCAGVEDGLF
jgi:menaquinone-dependent protoporphyrinogen IX oxidase